VLIRIFKPKRDEVKEQWRKLYNGKLHNFFSSPGITTQIKSWRMTWTGHVASMGEGRNLDKVLAGKPEGRNPLGR
jgi:hypothetical protein